MPRTCIKKTERQQYSKDDLKNAIDSIKEGGTIRQVARDSHMPQATLQRHAAGDVEHFGPGRPTYFTVEEEKYLASALTEWGEPLTTHDFLAITAVYARELGRPNMFSNEIASYDWYNGFMKRHAEFKLKTPQLLKK
ncbi:unnamed protein product [Didymodactylos carnosus]|uniref:Uncharacterized protein n=1 Tax=Didymodactylos carnosus TaxID=1234261 RepID=A0A814M776_9BILA|nr:unnamed protein product [Didymodactylos carnosus]CAF3841607.1 unnamed protein product [Didymodactylos carnosus]